MLEVVRSDYCLGYCANIVFSVWHTQLNVDHIPEIRRVYAQVHARNPSGFGALTFVARDAAPVAAEARKPLTEVYESFDSNLKGVSVVLEAEGVKGATLRFVLNTLQLIIRPSYPIEVHPDINHGANWLQARLGTGSVVAELTRAIQEYERTRAAPAR